MHKSDFITVLQESNGSVWVNRIGAPGRYDLPVVILVLVVITRNLLLKTSHRQSLHVRVQQTTAVAVIFQGDGTAVGDFQRRLGKVVTTQMGLEEGRHLGVAGAGSVKDEEMHLEARGVDDEGEDYETGDSGNPVGDVCALLAS